MPALPAQFTDAKSNIEPKPADVANAIRTHEQVRDALETSDKLKAMGVDTVLIGSYARHVSIHRMKDVDVLSKLPDAGDVDPGELLDLVAAVLADVFDADDVERQDRSIKVDFPDYDLSVDAVPARPCGDHWEIPDREGGWEETDPLELAELTSQMNAANDEQYVPTVKLIRQARRANLDDTPPGGLYLEIATYHAFAAGIDADGTAEYLVAALHGVAAQLAQASVSGLPDPTLDGKTISTRATTEQLVAAADTFSALAAQAQAALDSDDDCWAALQFRELLGRNSDDEWVFPMPSHCNDDGTWKSAGRTKAAGSAVIAGGDSRFA